MRSGSELSAGAASESEVEKGTKLEQKQKASQLLRAKIVTRRTSDAEAVPALATPVGTELGTRRVHTRHAPISLSRCETQLDRFAHSLRCGREAN